MTRAIETRGYGDEAGGQAPQRLTRRPQSPHEQAGADWVLALLAVLFMVGNLVLESHRW